METQIAILSNSQITCLRSSFAHSMNSFSFIRYTVSLFLENVKSVKKTLYYILIQDGAIMHIQDEIDL